MDVATVVGWVGTLLFVVRLLPQPLKLRRTGDAAGVSATAVTNATVSDAGWFFHGVTHGLPPVWFASLVAVPLDLWTLWHLRSRVGVRALASGALWGVVLAVAAIGGGRVAFGVALGASVVVNHAPQVWSALRSHSLSGISPATWWFGLTDALLWGGYGLAERDAALIAYGLVLGAASVTVLSALWWRRPPGGAGLDGAAGRGTRDGDGRLAPEPDLGNASGP